MDVGITKESLLDAVRRTVAASGAPAIFAVAAARLGQSVAFVGSVGEERFGQFVAKRLAAEGVDTTGLATTSLRTTGMAFVGYDAAGAREFVFHLRGSAADVIQPDAIPQSVFDGVRWLHLSGSSLVLNEAMREACWYAVTQAKTRGGRVSFDPNFRPELMGVAEATRLFEPFLAACDLLLPTVEEARLLTGQESLDGAAAMLRARYGVPVAVKLGAAGCAIYTEADVYRGPAFLVDEIDPTGAGDCFNAACVVGLEQGWPLEFVAQFASAAGALAVTRMGPMEGAATEGEIRQLVEAHHT